MKLINKLFAQELITSTAYFSPLIFMAVFLSDQGFSASQVSTLMLFSALSSRGSRVIFAPFLNILRIRTTFILCQFVGGVGYLLLSFSSDFSIALIALTMIGFFYANTALLIRVILSEVKDARTAFSIKYAKLQVFTNIAGAISPILMNALFAIDQSISFICIALLLSLSMVFSYIYFKEIELTPQKPWFRSFFGLLLTSKLFIMYFLGIVLWFSYAQVFSFVPLVLSVKYAAQNFIWTISLLNAVIIIIFSVRVNTALSRAFSNYQIISIALGFIILGIASFQIYDIYTLFLGVFFISIAEMLFIPAIQGILSTSISSDRKVAIFAINACLMAIGEGIGFKYGSLMALTSQYGVKLGLLLLFAILVFAMIISWFRGRRCTTSNNI